MCCSVKGLKVISAVKYSSYYYSVNIRMLAVCAVWLVVCSDL